MPYVNVKAPRLVTGLNRPFKGERKNVNFSEQEIEVLKRYGATVEYIHTEKAPIVKPAKPVVAPEVKKEVPVLEESVVEQMSAKDDPEVPEVVTVTDSTEKQVTVDAAQPVKTHTQSKQNSGKKHN